MVGAHLHPHLHPKVEAPPPRGRQALVGGASEGAGAARRDGAGWAVAAEDAMWCEIRVADHLDALWSARFEGLTIRHAADGDSILAGPLVDQAALHGVLARVRDLGLTLRTVDCRELGPGERRDGGERPERRRDRADEAGWR